MVTPSLQGQDGLTLKTTSLCFSETPVNVYRPDLRGDNLDRSAAARLALLWLVPLCCWVSPSNTPSLSAHNGPARQQAAFSLAPIVCYRAAISGSPPRPPAAPGQSFFFPQVYLAFSLAFQYIKSKVLSFLLCYQEFSFGVKYGSRRS